jgi:predicted GTPase
LRRLDRRQLYLQQLKDGQLVESYKNKQLYPEHVNLYVTGRTGAGKSSLGNRFLTGSPLGSTGHQDCTSVVQYFRLASNLGYFDLPGSCGSDAFENINRAALFIPQLTEEGLQPTPNIPTLDFTNAVRTGIVPDPQNPQKIPLHEWESADHQKTFRPDVILYVIAPHGHWLRDDRKYLHALLKSRSDAGLPANVIFALNLFQNPDGTLKPTPQNVAGARMGITDTWKLLYPGSPPIIEVNSLTGKGLEELTAAICQVLPAHKIGNMGNALKAELRQAATAERSKRFRRLLLALASRLATFKVDSTIGRQDLLQVVLEAVAQYGLEVFHEEDAILAAQRELVALLTRNVAEESRNNRETAIKITVSDVEEVPVTTEEVVDKSPIIEQVEEEEIVPSYTIRNVPVPPSLPALFANKAAEGLTHMALSPIGALQTVFGEKRTVHDEVSDFFAGFLVKSNQVLEETTRTVTRLRERFVGMREEKAMVTRMVPKVVLRDQEVGKEALVGGRRVVEDVLSLGLAMEQLPPGENPQVALETALTRARQVVNAKLAPLAGQIDAAAELPGLAEREKQLMSLLAPLFAQ